MQAKGICFDGSRLDSQLSQFVSELNSPVLITDTNGIIQFTNDHFQSMSQFEPEDSIGKRPSLWASGSQKDEFYKALWSAISSGNTWKGSIENLRKDRSSYHASMTILPVLNNQQQIVHYVAMHKTKNPDLYDVDSKIFLKNQSDQISQNFPHLCHDLRNYLTSIIGTAGIMCQQNLDEKTGSMVKRINSSANFLNLMMSDVLDLSKESNNGSNLLSEINVFVPDLLSEVCDVFYDAVLNRRNKLSFECEPQLIHQGYLTDKYKIQRILSNLIGNAIKFTQNGKINVSVKKLHAQSDSDLILFSVKDSGIGIEKKNNGHIFKEFSQEDPSTSSKYGGSGLGLSLCKLFVTSMGGEIGFTSEKGIGSEFWFTLPLNKNSAPYPDDIKSEYHASLKVLVCDDDETQQIILKRTLELLGVDCTTASDGKEARNLLQKGSFDFLFLDCNMQSEDGYKCAMKIRRENTSDSKSLKIIGLTGYSNEMIVNKCIKSGMNACLTKIADPVMMSEYFIKIFDAHQNSSSSVKPTDEKADIFQFRKEKLPVICN